MTYAIDAEALDVDSILDDLDGVGEIPEVDLEGLEGLEDELLS